MKMRVRRIAGTTYDQPPTECCLLLQKTVRDGVPYVKNAINGKTVDEGDCSQVSLKNVLNIVLS